MATRESQYSKVLKHLLEEGATITDDLARTPAFGKCCRLADVIYKIRTRTEYDVKTRLVPNGNGSEHGEYYINRCPECGTFLASGESMCQCKKGELL